VSPKEAFFMNCKNAFRRGQYLVQMNRAHPDRPRRFELLGRDWDLLDGVFAPVYCRSTEFFATWIPYPIGGTFLEIGSGSGVIAVTAALQGCAHVTALDISANAVENTRRNVARHNVSDRFRVLCSDLFASLDRHERFDCIFWNSNFIEPPEGFLPRTDMEAAIFDPRYATHRHFLEEAPEHLSGSGHLLPGFSSLGDQGALARMAAAEGMRVEVVRESEPGLLAGGMYQLLELKKTSL
jgi:release factor glutamine methyltransferase